MLVATVLRIDASWPRGWSISDRTPAHRFLLKGELDETRNAAEALAQFLRNLELFLP